MLRVYVFFNKKQRFRKWIPQFAKVCGLFHFRQKWKPKVDQQLVSKAMWFIPLSTKRDQTRTSKVMWFIPLSTKYVVYSTFEKQPIRMGDDAVATRSCPYRNLYSIPAGCLAAGWLLAGLAAGWLAAGWLGWAGLGWLAAGWAGWLGWAGCWLGWLGRMDGRNSATLELRGARRIN